MRHELVFARHEHSASLSLRSLSACVCAMSTQLRWNAHFPRARKRPRDLQSTRGGPVPKRLRSRSAPRGAAAPAAAPVASAPARSVDKSGVALLTSTSALAARLACGRTEEAFQLLANTRLFHLDGSDDLPVRGLGLQPGRGLQADVGGGCVYILDTFTRRGRLFADVAQMHARPRSLGEFALGKVRTVPASELGGVKLAGSVQIVGGGRVLLPACRARRAPVTCGSEWPLCHSIAGGHTSVPRAQSPPSSRRGRSPECPKRCAPSSGVGHLRILGCALLAGRE